MKSNKLAQQRSGYHVTRGVSHVQQGPMLCFSNIDKGGLKLITSATNERFGAGEDKDWRKLFVVYLRNLIKMVNMNVRRVVFIYTFIDDSLYCRIVGDIYSSREIGRAHV